jgi:DNA end-binding protein Ku
MAPNMRVIWNGAISFGLVNIPVALHTATNETGLDFDWLDKRTMDLVGYKRINKKTGQEIGNEDIVRGISYEKGRYVVLTDEEIKNALAGSTQVIEIESFANAAEISPIYCERPYYLAPDGKADKAYALLRETLLQTKRAGIARVVIRTKQYLAAIVPAGPALVLILLRWAKQIRPLNELKLPSEGAEGLAERELSMAAQLVDAMTEPWDHDRYQDTFTARVMALVEEKVKTGHIETVIRPEAGPAGAGLAEVVDFTELLRRSLQKKTAGQAEKPAAGMSSASKSTGSDKALPRRAKTTGDKQ